MELFDVRLNSLLAVTEYKNFTKAAKSLNLTQPAVSQHINQLEQMYGVKIFNKAGNTIIPTTSGEILIKYARRMKGLCKELDTKISDEKKFSKSLNVGITHSSEGNIIPLVLAELGNQNDGTTIKFYSDSINNLYEKLLNFEIDLAVVEGKVINSKFSKVLLDTDSLVAVLSKDNPLSQKTVLTLNDLEKEKLILRTSNSATRNLFISQLEDKDMTLDDFNVVLEIDNTSAIKDLVSHNIGVSILPKSVCYNEIKNKTLVTRPIQDLNMSTEINLVFTKTFENNSILDNLIKTYQELVKR